MFQIHSHVLSQRPTAHLAQTMSLLIQTTEELRQKIESELASNPALELVEERRCPTCHLLLKQAERCPVCSQHKSNELDEPVVFLSPRDDIYLAGDGTQDDSPMDNIQSEENDLPTYVLRQIAPDLGNQECRIAAYLLTNLDDDGLLSIPLVEAAHYYHVTMALVTNIQKIIQRADPLGVCSSSPQEALLTQIEVLSETNAVPPLTVIIIKEGMDLLSRRQYHELAHRCGATLRQVMKAVDFIGENLNPFPARSHWGDTRQPSKANLPTYQRPDIVIYYLNEERNNQLAVEIVMPVGGTLRINPMFRQAIQTADNEKKELWKKDIESANLLVKCLQQRNHTILRLMQRVASLQKKYIIHGDKYLKPVTRASLAKELGVHESTISRAVANKTIQLPNRRIVPLSAFFDRNLNIRTVLCDVIESEPYPLSDTELTGILSTQGFNVARRTVAKYRAMEGILPAHLRRSMPRVEYE